MVWPIVRSSSSGPTTAAACHGASAGCMTRGRTFHSSCRWPGKLEPGGTNDDLVAAIDFGPTVLSLAAVPIPKHLQGRAFLGDAKGRTARIRLRRSRPDGRNLRHHPLGPRQAVQVPAKLRAAQDLRPEDRVHGPNADDEGTAAAVRPKES